MASNDDRSLCVCVCVGMRCPLNVNQSPSSPKPHTVWGGEGHHPSVIIATKYRNFTPAQSEPIKFQKTQNIRINLDKFISILIFLDRSGKM